LQHAILKKIQPIPVSSAIDLILTVSPEGEDVSMVQRLRNFFSLSGSGAVSLEPEAA
jgi:hypothetical protein